MKYSELRPYLDTGDAVLFLRLTWKQAGWRNFWGWLGNWIIALAQYRSGETFDGTWEIVHVGCVVRDHDTDEITLLEFTAGQVGPGMRRLSKRIADYPGKVLILPLKPKYRERIAWSRVQAWIRTHRRDRYNWIGLTWPTLKHCAGWGRNGKRFCSEAVVDFEQHIGAIPVCRPVLRGSRIVKDIIAPQTISPSELPRMVQYDWSMGGVVEI